DFAGDDGRTGLDHGFAGHAGALVLGKDRVQHCIGNLVGDLVRMAFGDRLGSEEIAGHELVSLYADEKIDANDTRPWRPRNSAGGVVAIRLINRFTRSAVPARRARASRNCRKTATALPCAGGRLPANRHAPDRTTPAAALSQLVPRPARPP